MARHGNLILALIYIVGLAIYLCDFVLTGINAGTAWCLIVPPLLMLVVFLVCGWSAISESACDAISWSMISVLSLLSLMLNMQSGGEGEASNTPMLATGGLLLLVSVAMTIRSAAAKRA